MKEFIITGTLDIRKTLECIIEAEDEEDASDAFANGGMYTIISETEDILDHTIDEIEESQD